MMSDYVYEICSGQLEKHVVLEWHSHTNFTARESSSRRLFTCNIGESGYYKTAIEAVRQQMEEHKMMLEELKQELDTIQDAIREAEKIPTEFEEFRKIYGV
jgi:hypothetical protein